MNSGEYRGPSLAAEEVRSHFGTQRDIKILDCGAGTGLVGGEVNISFR